MLRIRFLKYKIIRPYVFLKNDLWFNGPNWLQNEKEICPQFQIERINDLPELRKNVCLLLNEKMSEFLLTFSSFSTLVRVVAYCLRFKYRQDNEPLSVDELDRAERRIIKIVQAFSFSEEIRLLSQSKELSRGSKILSLNPFLDDDNILRVGGRLKNAESPYTVQHPILLHKSHSITDLIVRHYHLKGHHSSLQTSIRKRRY